MERWRVIPRVSRAALIAGRNGLLEAGIVLGSYVLYFLVRGNVVERVPEAMTRAAHLVRLEERLGIFWELEIQDWVLSNAILIHFFNFIYIWAHWPIIALAALWLYILHRQRYYLFRNAFLISGGIGLIIFSLFPTAPPRLMPQWGFVDTMLAFAGLNYEQGPGQPGAFVNSYAAVPSLHFGWNFLVGIAILWTARAVIVKAVGGVIMPTAMFLAVVGTANHFIFDALAGGVLCLWALAAAWLWQRHGPQLLHTLAGGMARRLVGTGKA